jgi:hypothetical protein
MPAARHPSPKRGLLAVLLSLLTLAGLTLAATPASAQIGGVQGWVPAARMPDLDTGVQIQNLGTTDADISLVMNHGDALADPTARVKAGQSFTWLIPPGGPGRYSGATVYSTNPVGIIVNSVSYSGTSSQSVGSSPGFTSKSRSSTILLPLLKNNASGASTRIALQNVSKANLRARVSYYTPTGTLIDSPGEIPLDAEQDTLLVDQPSDLPPSFHGLYAGRIEVVSKDTTETNNLVATVIERNDLIKGVNTWAGIPREKAGTTLPVPLVAANHTTTGNFNDKDMFTGIQVFNAGTRDTSVDITFGTNTLATPDACPTSGLQTRTVQLAANASSTLLQRGPEDPQFATCRYVGSAKVSITPGWPASDLVGVDSQASATGQAVIELVGLQNYRSTVTAPLIQGNNYGIFSGMQVQNVSDQDRKIDLRYSASTAEAKDGQAACGPGAPALEQKYKDLLASVAANSSETVLQNDLRSPATGEICRYIGSATIEGSAPVAAIVNQVVPDGADRLSAYITGEW